jgi:hypothetical protein
MTILAWAAVLRIVRVVFSAFREAQEEPVPEGAIGGDVPFRHRFARELITGSMSSLEKRIGRDLVTDSTFSAGIDYLLMGLRLIRESVVRERP